MIIKKNIFPSFNYKEKKVSDGILEERFIFCKRNFNSKCIKYYEDIKTKNGLFKCPYGFTTYKKNDINYTSILIEKSFDRKLAQKNTTKKDNKPIHTNKKLDNLISHLKDFKSRINAKQHIIREYDKNKLIFSNKKETLDDTLHELRKLNNILKKQAYTLKNELEKSYINNPNLNLKSKNILATTQLISARLNAYDFTLNPELSQLTQPFNTNIYKKFDKARQCLEVVTRDLGVKINFIGTSKCKFECYDIIDLLPFILFENALKFNFNNNDINCEFINKDNKLSRIIISNKAELPKAQNLNDLKNKHVRGDNIQDIQGTGKGLYIANLICDYNDFNLEIEDSDINIVNSKMIGTFKTIITITKNI